MAMSAWMLGALLVPGLAAASVATGQECTPFISEVTVALSKWESSKLRAHRQAKRRLTKAQLAEIAETNKAVVVKTRLRDVEITTGETKAGYHRRFRAMGTFDVTLRPQHCQQAEPVS